MQILQLFLDQCNLNEKQEWGEAGLGQYEEGGVQIPAAWDEKDLCRGCMTEAWLYCPEVQNFCLLVCHVIKRVERPLIATDCFYQTILMNAVFANIVERVRILANQLCHHVVTLWLFTLSDLKTIIGPAMIFGVLNALCVSVFGMPPVPIHLILRRAPCSLFWTWANLLPFAIDNQRQGLAVEEDAINKPWRPIPSGRITTEKAKGWMLRMYQLAMLFSLYVGGLKQCLTLVILGFWYNDLKGADGNPLVRNFINACGFLCFFSGVMKVAYGSPLQLEWGSPLLQWLGIVGVIVFSSVHTQDMADQEGDKVRGRRTVPLVIGDWFSRLTIAAAVTAWSWLGPRFWDLTSLAYVPTVGLGIWVTMRTLFLRDVKGDKRTFKLWNLWLLTLYVLPFNKHHAYGAGEYSVQTINVS